MDEHKIRVINQTAHDVGIVRLNGVSQNIKAGSFVNLSRDDIDYLASVAPRLFQNNDLVVTEPEVSEDIGVTPVFAKDIETECKKVLGGRVNALRDWFEQEHTTLELETMAKMAENADVAASKMRVLAEFMPGRFTE